MYAFAAGAQRAIGFLLLPLYTRALDPAEYGDLSLLLSMAAAVAILLTFALDLAIFRTYFEFESDPVLLRRYIDSIWRFLVAAPLIGALLLSVCAWPFLGESRVTPIDVTLALVGMALLVSATTLPLSVLRAQERLRAYLKVTAVTMVTTPALTVLLVVVLDWGITGWLLALVLSAGLSLAASMRVLPWHWTGGFDREMVRRSVRFSVPLLPHALSHWALQLADRSLLAVLIGSSALGIYSLAANFAVPFMIAVSSLNQGFLPIYARAARNPQAQSTVERTVVLQVGLVVVGCLAGALLGPAFLELVAPESYSGAASLVPWIILGFGFLGLYCVPMNGATVMAGRSGFAWLTTAAGAATNVAFILVFVPDHGIEAAAIASAVGYLVLLAAAFVYAHARPNPLHYRWKQIVPTIAAGVAIYGLGVVTTPSAPGATLGVRTLWVLVMVCVLVALRVVPVRLPGDRHVSPPSVR